MQEQAAESPATVSQDIISRFSCVRLVQLHGAITGMIQLQGARMDACQWGEAFYVE